MVESTSHESTAHCWQLIEIEQVAEVIVRLYT